MNMDIIIKGSGTNSDMSSLFQLYSAQTKLLRSRLCFLPQGKMMIGLYFITLTQIKEAHHPRVHRDLKTGERGTSGSTQASSYNQSESPWFVLNGLFIYHNSSLSIIRS